ncbi:hypothetical protein EVG20_g6543 [Dentipellis fragilis]|uniref:BTB domain-containing protein n=1 Tax=Dentipellis fragilis TaxID=205917 RepID=A0A4Y9YLQ5_9AGAM|nr:hypothetical protein EVG20_g6543 [Dentipellis fragilis]
MIRNTANRKPNVPKENRKPSKPSTVTRRAAFTVYQDSRLVPVSTASAAESKPTKTPTFKPGEDDRFSPTLFTKKGRASARASIVSGQTYGLPLPVLPNLKGKPAPTPKKPRKRRVLNPRTPGDADDQDLEGVLSDGSLSPWSSSRERVTSTPTKRMHAGGSPSKPSSSPTLFRYHSDRPSTPSGSPLTPVKINMSDGPSPNMFDHGLSSNGHYVSARPSADKQLVSQPVKLASPGDSPAVVTRHPSFSFDDGNLAIVAGQTHYFLVHRGLIYHRSAFLKNLIEKQMSGSQQTLEGYPVLRLEGSPDDLLLFVQALYDGLFSVLQEEDNFSTVSVLLRLASIYYVESLRRESLDLLLKAWPVTLSQWDRRERQAMRSDPVLPHPMAIINLARQINAPELLPSAFYDLSRHLPSAVVCGFTDACTGAHITLAPDDLVRFLRGREAASRFFSTFVVNALEGRKASQWCTAPPRHCQGAFELATYELLRDVNGVVCGRTLDPLFAMVDALKVLMKDGSSAAETQDESAVGHTCDMCRIELAGEVDAAREQLWGKLPEWFGVEVPDWD